VGDWPQVNRLDSAHREIRQQSANATEQGERRAVVV
jgi:hypothetical protein